MKSHWRLMCSSVGLLALLVGALGANALFAHHQGGTATPANRTGTYQLIAGQMLSRHAVTMATIPAAQLGTASAQPGVLPVQHGVSTETYLQRKTSVAQNPAVPRASTLYHAASPQTPALLARFPGLADSGSICPYSAGCVPPDMVLDVSPTWVLQGVNTSFAVYTPSGTLQAGWPKTAQSFFSVPNPGSCDPKGPFLSDPRPSMTPPMPASGWRSGRWKARQPWALRPIAPSCRCIGLPSARPAIPMAPGGCTSSI